MAIDAEFDAKSVRIKRRLQGRAMRKLHVEIGAEFYKDLKTLADQRSLGYTVERLIWNAMRRKRANTTCGETSGENTSQGAAGMQQ